MKLLKYLSAIVPILLGLAAARWTSLSLWYDMKDGLLAFLGFLAASLIQVMPVTANFLQSDRLSPDEALRLTTSLTKQQYYWIGLLTVTIAAMVMVIMGFALKDHIGNMTPIFKNEYFWNISWSAITIFMIVASVSFVFTKMLGLFNGILALHRLRSELVINSAKRAAAEKIAEIQMNRETIPPIVPNDYGQIIRPH